MHINSHQEATAIPRLGAFAHAPTENAADNVYPTPKTATSFSARNQRLDREMQRVQAALETVARLVINDQIFIPILERLEYDLSQLRLRVANNPLDRARAILQAKAID